MDFKDFFIDKLRGLCYCKNVDRENVFPVRNIRTGEKTMSKKNKNRNNTATLEQDQTATMPETEGQQETTGQETTGQPEIALQDVAGEKPAAKPAKPPRKTDQELLEDAISNFDLAAFCDRYGIDQDALRALVAEETKRTFQGQPLNPFSLPVRVYDVLNGQDAIYKRHAVALLEGRKETETIKDFFLAVLHLEPSALGSHIKRTSGLSRENLYMFPILH